MKPAPLALARWDSDRWAAVERRFPRTSRLLACAYVVPRVRDLVRALFLDRLDDAHEDGRSVGYVAHELGIGRRTAWRWILEMERARVRRDAPTEQAKKRENAGLGGIADEGAATVPERPVSNGEKTSDTGRSGTVGEGAG